MAVFGSQVRYMTLVHSPPHLPVMIVYVPNGGDMYRRPEDRKIIKC